MAIFHIILNSFLAISDKICIFAPMDAKKDYLSDQEIVEGLIARDNDITREFCAFIHILWIMMLMFFVALNLKVAC